ncbi:MAG: outer membrane beta-barrel protein [Sulfurovaceae bacterium]|nr:outer membrane beta-barrel protein [Sulfurovaceae bacterium]
MKKFSGSVVVGLLLMSGLAVAGGDIAPVEPEVVVPAPVVMEDESGFYLGVAYSRADWTRDFNGYNQRYIDIGTVAPDIVKGNLVEWSGKGDVDYNAIMAQAGYKFNKYIALEGRYWWSLGNSDRSVKGSYTVNGGTPTSFDFNVDYGEKLRAWGIYAKPMYPVTDKLDIYALLGGGNVTLKNDYFDRLDENDFQWGLGASYKITDNVSIFLDYVNLLNKDGGIAWDTSNNGTEVGSMGEHNWNDKVYTVNVGLTYKF